LAADLLDGQVGDGAADGSRQVARGGLAAPGDPHVGHGVVFEVAGPLAVAANGRDEQRVTDTNGEERDRSAQTGAPAGGLDEEDARPGQRVAEPGAHDRFDDSVDGAQRAFNGHR
jgi:hypothetical protein